MSRIDVALVVGGRWHDFDYARRELLDALAVDERIRVRVAHDYEDAALLSAQALVSYTCEVRPSHAVQVAWRRWVEQGGRWLALHGTNSAIDPPAGFGEEPFTTPRAFPLWVDTLGSQFLSHPAMAPYPVAVSAGAEGDPLVAGLPPFHAGEDELYLCEYHGELVPLLETRWTGDTGVPGFAEHLWPVDEPRLVLYRRRLGAGEVVYFTLGHCRSRWDMVDPPFNGAPYPRTERGSWDVPEYREVLRRGIAWVTGIDAVAEVGA
jgi:type 1 glutamine amidotransferase